VTVRIGRRLAGVLVAAAIVMAACSGPAPTATPGDAASPGTAATSAPASPNAAVTASPTASSASPGEAGPANDISLLGLLPATIDGAAVGEEPESFAEAVASADFVASVEAAAFPFVADAGDLASGVVARLRPGVFSDAWFRDWRDSYNDGACSQAGGLVRNAEATIGARTVYIAGCAEGLLVYHAYLPERGVVVSLFSLGTRRFGERLMEGLRP